MTLPTLYWFCKSVVVAVSAEDFIGDVLGLEGKYFAGTFPNSDSSFVRQRNNSAGAVHSSVNALGYFGANKIAGFIRVSRFALGLTLGKAVLVVANNLPFAVTNCFDCERSDVLPMQHFRRTGTNTGCVQPVCLRYLSLRTIKLSKPTTSDFYG